MSKELPPKALIFKELRLKYSEEDEGYIAYSPLVDGIIGIGDHEDEAVEEFARHLEVHETAAAQGRHAIYNKVGRPSEGRVTFNTMVKAEIKERLKAYAESLGCSAGEVVEYIFLAHEAAEEKTPKASVPVKAKKAPAVAKSRNKLAAAQ